MISPFFNWLKDTGTQAVELFITACAAIGALLLTWYFGKKSLTKRDLAGLEQNTAETSDHLQSVHTHLASVDTRIADINTGITSVDTSLKKQKEGDQLKIRANRVSIAARGYQSGNVPLDLQLSVKGPQEPEFAINHLELCNESDLPFGSFACAKTGSPQELNYSASIPMKTIGDWFRSGAAEELIRRRRLKIRIWMYMSEIEVPRDMAVIVIQSDGGGYPAFDVQGSV
jgi:hypothetical protein